MVGSIDASIFYAYALLSPSVLQQLQSGTSRIISEKNINSITQLQTQRHTITVRHNDKSSYFTFLISAVVVLTFHFCGLKNWNFSVITNLYGLWFGEERSLLTRFFKFFFQCTSLLACNNAPAPLGPNPMPSKPMGAFPMTGSGPSKLTNCMITLWPIHRSTRSAVE